MVACVAGPDGSLLGCHRTWLARDAAGAWRKAPVEPAKKTMGACKGGTIRLWRGASGKAWRDAPAGDELAIAEGIEDALTVALALPRLRVVAGIAVGLLRFLDLPAAVGTVTVFVDNDAREVIDRRTGEVREHPAHELVRTALDRWWREGRRVAVARPPATAKDINALIAS